MIGDRSSMDLVSLFGHLAPPNHQCDGVVMAIARVVARTAGLNELTGRFWGRTEELCNVSVHTEIRYKGRFIIFSRNQLVNFPLSFAKPP
jgi:hypothetical protein